MREEAETKGGGGGQIGEAGESVQIEKEMERLRETSKTPRLKHHGAHHGRNLAGKGRKKSTEEARSKAELDAPQPENSES